MNRALMRVTGLVMLLLLGGVSTAFAQGPVVTRAGGLKKKAYQTYAAMTLYVDPTGSDSNACTASGTSACLTLGGALLKVPIHIRHLVTINVATGTYTEVFRVQGFFIEGANGAASTAALTITGTQAAFTVATGSNSGTVSSYTNTSTTDGAHALLNDATQTWTVNDLRGRYVTVTSGSGSGEYHLITSNTATQLSLAAPFTAAPTGASVYAIRTPGPVFTGSNSYVGSVTGRGTITMTDLTFQPASGTAFFANVVPSLTQTRVRFVGTSSGITTANAALWGPALWVLSQVFVSAGTTNGFNLPTSRYTITEIFALCTSGTTCSGSGLNFATKAGTIVNLVTGTVAGPFTQQIYMDSSTSTPSTNIWLDCSAGGVGVLSPAPTADQGNFAGRGWSATRAYFNGCTTALSLNSGGSHWAKNNIFTSVTNAVVLSGGARLTFETPTFSGVTNQLTIDGTVYTDADLTTFTRITGPQGSYATRP